MERISMYSTEYEYVGQMKDPEMDRILHDIFSLMNKRCKWENGDTGEKTYREAVNEFKDKWLKKSRKDILKRTIDEECEKLKITLYKAVGEKVDEKYMDAQEFPDLY